MPGGRSPHWLLCRFLLQRLLGGAPLARSLASAGEAARPVKRTAFGAPLNGWVQPPPGCVKELPPQDQLQARVVADVRARQGGRLQPVLAGTPVQLRSLGL